MTNLSSMPLLDRVDTDDGGSLSSYSTTEDAKTIPDISSVSSSEDSVDTITTTLFAGDSSIIISTSTTTEAADNHTFQKETVIVIENGPHKAPWVSAENKGRLVLLILAMAYGSLNISMRLVFGRPEPPEASVSSTIQGWFAVLCFMPLLYRKQYCQGSTSDIVNTEKPKEGYNGPSFWRFALELAFIDFGTQALISTSLEATPGARASFLVQMSVVFTPLVSVLFGKQRVQKQVWLACFVALAGLFVLSYAQGEDDEIIDDSRWNAYSRGFLSSWSLNKGDCCCLLAAFCWSFYIYRMSAYGDFFDETKTQFVKNATVAMCYTLWMIASFVRQSLSQDNTVSPVLWKGWKDPVVWMILFYTALGPCTVADVCQQKAQASVTAAETNVILSLEPVFTTLLGLLVLGEMPSIQELGGGLLITTASIIASCGGPSSSR